jgi:hypothetical protein
LAPGSTDTLQATFGAPAQPGDLAAALRFPGSVGLPEIPVAVRTLIPVGPGGGTFTGTLTGGNARAFQAPTQTYAFDVPGGVRDLALSLSLPDAGYALAGYLIDPHGDVLDSASNVDPTGARLGALQLFRAAPQAGRWRFVLQEGQTSGNQTAIGFSARIALDAADVSASGLGLAAAIAWP